MRRIPHLLAALAVIVAAGSAARAQMSPEVAGDVECAVVTGFVDAGDDVDPGAQQASAMYFIGKLSARGIDYSPLIATAMTYMTDAEVSAAGERCGNELIVLGRNLDAISDRLEALDSAQ